MTNGPVHPDLKAPIVQLWGPQKPIQAPAYRLPCGAIIGEVEHGNIWIKTTRLKIFKSIISLYHSNPLIHKKFYTVLEGMKFFLNFNPGESILIIPIQRQPIDFICMVTLLPQLFNWRLSEISGPG